MAGELQTFFQVELNDLYYKSHNRWTSKDYDLSRLTEEDALRVSRRYPGSTVEKGWGYDFILRTFQELEPDANQLIRDAVTLARRDGQSLERVLMTAEASYRAAKN